MREILDALGYIPRIAVWELTLACNMRCGHCGSRAGEPRPDEMSDAEMLQLAKDLTDLGTNRVTLSGGEPIMRKIWPDIARTLRAGGARINMVSNAWGWNPHTVQTAIDAGLSNVSFSVDGMHETHDEIRRAGSFARCAQAFDWCREAGLQTASIMTINRKNLGQIEQVHDFLAAHGVKHWQVQLSDAMGNQEDNLDWAFHPEDAPEVEARVAALMRDTPMQISIGDNLGYYGPHEEELRGKSKFGFWTGCMAGVRVIGIEANGNIKGCLSQQHSSFVEGNVRDTPLREIWTRPGAFAYNREFNVDQLEGFCRDCRFNDICRGGCTCTAHFASGSRFDNPICVYRVLEQRKQGVVEGIGRERESSTEPA